MTAPAYADPSAGAATGPVDRTTIAGLIAQASTIRDLTADLSTAARRGSATGDPRRAASIRAWATGVHRGIEASWVMLLRALHTGDAHALLPWLSAIVCAAPDLAGPPHELSQETARIRCALRALSTDLRIATRNLCGPGGRLMDGVTADLAKVMRDVSVRYLAG